MQPHGFIKIHWLIFKHLFCTYYLKCSYKHMMCLVKCTPSFTVPSPPLSLSPNRVYLFFNPEFNYSYQDCMSVEPPIGNMGNLPWATSLKKTDYPPLNYQLAMDPELWKGLHIHPGIWLIWSCMGLMHTALSAGGEVLFAMSLSLFHNNASSTKASGFSCHYYYSSKLSDFISLPNSEDSLSHPPYIYAFAYVHQIQSLHIKWGHGAPLLKQLSCLFLTW